ncbi:hypothetical protein ACVWY3_004142 [Bradyrhizobium sp. USDA 4486]
MADTYDKSEFRQSGIFLCRWVDREAKQPVPQPAWSAAQSGTVQDAARAAPDCAFAPSGLRKHHPFDSTGVPSAIVVTPFRSTIIP